MSTASKTASASKKSSKITKTESESKIEANSESEMDQDIHSVFNGEIKDYKKHPTFARYLSKVYLLIKSQVDISSAESILNLTWGESEEALSKLASENEVKINAKVKKEVIKAAKFVPVGIDTPRKSGSSIFYNEVFKQIWESKSKEDKEGINHSKANADAYAALSSSEREKYEQRCIAEKELFAKELIKQKQAKIDSGELPEEKLSKPLSSYMLFTNEIRPQLILKYKEDVEKYTEALEKFKKFPNKYKEPTAPKKMIDTTGKQAGDMWKALSSDKKEKYTHEAKVLREEYNVKLEAWKSKELERQKKLTGTSDSASGSDVDVAVETTGKTENVSVAKPAKGKQEGKTKASKKIAEESVAEADEDANESDAEPVAVEKKEASAKKEKPSKKKLIKKIETENTSDNENEASDNEVVAVKTPTKSKSAKKESKA